MSECERISDLWVDFCDHSANSPTAQVSRGSFAELELQTLFTEHIEQRTRLQPETLTDVRHFVRPFTPQFFSVTTVQGFLASRLVCSRARLTTIGSACGLVFIAAASARNAPRTSFSTQTRLSSWGVRSVAAPPSSRITDAFARARVAGQENSSVRRGTG